MKIRQNVRHWAAKQALTMPVVGEAVRDRLVDLHTRVFLNRADAAHAPEREEHLDAFFDCTMDTYIAALQAGYPEAEAREITHIQANFDFYNHGWTEMMEFPPDEIETHYDRYAEFFGRYDISIDDPLGEFQKREVPAAPATPAKLEHEEHPHAEGGFADDVYVERDGRITIGGGAEPADLDISDAPGAEGEGDRPDDTTRSAHRE